MLTHSHTPQTTPSATFWKEFNSSLERKFTKLATDLDNIENLVRFDVTENVALLGATKDEILELVYSAQSNDRSTAQNDTSTDQSTLKTLHHEFASLSQDNTVLNKKIDNLHEENVFLNESLTLVLSRVRGLFEDGEVLHAKLDEIKDQSVIITGSAGALLPGRNAFP